MQCPVYGISTDETGLSTSLSPNFHYDKIFGTVFNRFIVQAVSGHPLTIYGKGTQIRGYLNIRDTMACVYLAITNLADQGELRVFNQFTETFSVNELADRVKRVGEKLDYRVEVEHYPNPRVEKEDHYYNPTYTGLVELGLKPHYLTDEILEGIFNVVGEYKGRINREAIFKGVKWK